MARRLIALTAAVALGIALALPSVALAQGTLTQNPFSPGLPITPTPTPTATTPTVITTPTTSTGGGGIGGGSAAAIAIGAIVILGGISLFIWRDARRRAPVRRPAVATSGDGSRSGSRQRAKPRKLSPAERRRRKRGRAR